MSEGSAFQTVKLHKKTLRRLRRYQAALEKPNYPAPPISNVIEMALDALRKNDPILSALDTGRELINDAVKKGLL